MRAPQSPAWARSVGPLVLADPRQREVAAYAGARDEAEARPYPDWA